MCTQEIAHFRCSRATGNASAGNALVKRTGSCSHGSHLHMVPSAVCTSAQSNITWNLHLEASRSKRLIWSTDAGYLHSHLHLCWMMSRKLQGCSVCSETAECFLCLHRFASCSPASSNYGSWFPPLEQEYLWSVRHKFELLTQSFNLITLSFFFGNFDWFLKTFEIASQNFEIINQICGQKILCFYYFFGFFALLKNDSWSNNFE